MKNYLYKKVYQLTIGHADKDGDAVNWRSVKAEAFNAGEAIEITYLTKGEYVSEVKLLVVFD